MLLLLEASGLDHGDALLNLVLQRAARTAFNSKSIQRLWLRKVPFRMSKVGVLLVKAQLVQLFWTDPAFEVYTLLTVHTIIRLCFWVEEVLQPLFFPCGFKGREITKNTGPRFPRIPLKKDHFERNRQLLLTS
jgi:hypothetical protein